MAAFSRAVGTLANLSVAIANVMLWPAVNCRDGLHEHPPALHDEPEAEDEQQMPSNSRTPVSDHRVHDIWIRPRLME